MNRKRKMKSVLSHAESEEIPVYPAKIGALNRVTIPKDVRSLLKVVEGEYILFRVIDGKVTVGRLD